MKSKETLNSSSTLNWARVDLRRMILSQRSEGYGKGVIVKKNCGFTLVELLVVISIIALLMAILVPSLSRAREQAKKVVCLSHVKQWGVIWYLYTQDHNGFFNEGWGGEGMARWYDALEGYYKDPQILCCPKVAAEKGAWFGIGSYGINGWCYNPKPGIKDIGLGVGPTSKNWRTVHVKNAAYVPMFQDAAYPEAWPNDTDKPREYYDVPSSAWGWLGHHICIDRHILSVNVAFLDFSARSVGLKGLWKLKWNKDFDIDGGPLPGEWPDWMKNAKGD